jgi:hypothetical protein
VNRNIFAKGDWTGGITLKLKAIFSPPRRTYREHKPGIGQQLAVLPFNRLAAFAAALKQTFNVKYFYFADGATRNIAASHRGAVPSAVGYALRVRAPDFAMMGYSTAATRGHPQ